jgi:hypothetical protein
MEYLAVGQSALECKTSHAQRLITNPRANDMWRRAPVKRSPMRGAVTDPPQRHTSYHTTRDSIHHLCALTHHVAGNCNCPGNGSCENSCHSAFATAARERMYVMLIGPFLMARDGANQG